MHSHKGYGVTRRMSEQDKKTGNIFGYVLLFSILAVAFGGVALGIYVINLIHHWMS